MPFAISYTGNRRIWVSSITPGLERQRQLLLDELKKRPNQGGLPEPVFTDIGYEGAERSERYCLHRGIRDKGIDLGGQRRFILVWQCFVKYFIWSMTGFHTASVLPI